MTFSTRRRRPSKAMPCWMALFAWDLVGKWMTSDECFFDPSSGSLQSQKTLMSAGKRLSFSVRRAAR